MQNLDKRLEHLLFSSPSTMRYTAPHPPDPEHVIQRPPDRATMLEHGRCFFQAVHPDHRELVGDVVFRDEEAATAGRQPHLGLLAWLLNVVHGDSTVPERIPPVVTQAYLDDPTAMPNASCTPCGLLLPVRPARHVPGEPGEWRLVEEAVTYFHVCPVCGGPVNEDVPE